MIIIGLYLVLWGKSEERALAIKEAIILASSNSEDNNSHRASAVSFKASSLNQPLLPSSASESV